MLTEKEAGELVAKFEKQVEDFDKRIMHIQRKVNTLNDQIANMVKMVVGRKFPDRKQWIMYPADGWKCEDKANPFALCVYDEGKDPVMDYCLYCGEPYERK